MFLVLAGSRDHSIKLWRNDEGNGTANYRPLESRIDHRVTKAASQQ